MYSGRQAGKTFTGSYALMTRLGQNQNLSSGGQFDLKGQCHEMNNCFEGLKNQIFHHHLQLTEKFTESQAAS